MSKLSITAVGTCRIHTPLRRAAGRYPIEVDHRRNYGFVHTSDEALQLVRFLQGDKQFRPEVAPLVIREARLADYEAESWQPSDLHIVEISSAKRITSLGDSVQSNYLAHHFADFFAHPGRSRTFWSLVKKAHRQQLVRFLDRQETYQLLSPEDRELLTTLQMEPQSFKAIKTDMAEIVERLGADKLLFLTHVNATGPDGELITQRDRLIRWVKMAAEQLGVPVFDPTAAMNDFGQEKALESGGLDLTHYTPAFYDRVYEEIHRAHVVPLIGAGDGLGALSEADEQVARRAAQLEAMLEHSDFIAASRDVHAAVEERPDALPLVELRGLIRSRIGDFTGAVADLTRRGDDGALSQAMRVGLVEALGATGDNARALKVAEKLFGEEYESAALYRAAAAAAEKLGRTELAITHAKQAFRKDRGDLGAALHALMLLSDHRSTAEVAAWRREVLENISDSASGALEIAIWSIRNHDDDVFAAAIKAVAAIDKAGTVDLLEDAFNAGMLRGVARSLEVAAALGRIPRGISERRLGIIEGTLAGAQELAEQGDADGSFEIARGLLPLEHIQSSQIPGRQLAREAVRLIRKLSQQVRISVREAHGSGDLEAVLGAGDRAGALLLALPDAAAIYARALHSTDRVEEALEVMKSVRANGSDDFVITRWTARFAAIAGDYSTALEAYGQLRKSKDPALAKVRGEVNRFFATAGRRALKELRAQVLDGEHEQALTLARLIREGVGEEERVDREMLRLTSLLRRRLKEVDEGEGDSQEREILLRQLADVAPRDIKNLKKLASHLMRGSRYSEAAEVWERIHKLEPADEKAQIQRERCARMARRRMAAWGEDLEAA